MSRSSSSAPWRLLLSCEHGGNRVPARYRALFAGHHGLLDSHRGWDPGALLLARRLRRATGAPLVSSQVSRLVVDLNRSPNHPKVLSDLMRPLGRTERALVVDTLHRPHRESGEALIRSLASEARVLHLAVHSFTPVLDGVERQVDIGLLYDPRRASEAMLARALRTAILCEAPRLRVRMNQPYRGTSDGWTTALRTRFSPKRYAGIELEMNQRFLTSRGSFGVLDEVVERALKGVLDGVSV